MYVNDPKNISASTSIFILEKYNWRGLVVDHNDFTTYINVTLGCGTTMADSVWPIQPTWSGPYLTYDYTPQELGLSNYSSNGAT